jgi:hypothetical protein
MKGVASISRAVLKAGMSHRTDSAHGSYPMYRSLGWIPLQSEAPKPDRCSYALYVVRRKQRTPGTEKKGRQQTMNKGHATRSINEGS